MKKAIIFDFDGTLTSKKCNVWKQLWESVGFFRDNNCPSTLLFDCFLQGKITHKEWCDLTCKYFVQKKMTKKSLDKVQSQVHLVDGLFETLDVLKDLGFSLHIVSGGVKNTILNALGGYANYFDSISANTLKFSPLGELENIVETQYDFEGKALFVDNLKQNGFAVENILFVGNSDNDEWVWKSGCKTLCINPDGTDGKNTTIWKYSIPNLSSLFEIVPLVKFLFQGA